MKKAKIYGFLQWHIHSKTGRQQDRSDEFSNDRKEENHFGHSNDSLGRRIVQRFLKKQPFPIRNSSANQKCDKGGKCHKTQTADLDQGEDHQLSKEGKGIACICYNQSGYTRS